MFKHKTEIVELKFLILNLSINSICIAWIKLSLSKQSWELFWGRFCFIHEWETKLQPYLGYPFFHVNKTSTFIVQQRLYGL